MLDASPHVVSRASASGLGGGPNDLSNGSTGGSREPTPVFRVATEHQAQALYEHITDPGRRYPVVGLTCRAGLRREPAVSVERVQAVVWPGVPIYIIEPRESRTLNNLLPRKLGAYNGAVRVWWPGVTKDSSPSWHPLILDPSGFYGDNEIEQLAEQFATPHPETIYDLPPEKQAAMRERLRIAAKAKRVVTVASFKDVRSLTSELRRTDREYPIVVVTAADGDSEPVFPPDELRDAIDPHVPIYVLANPAITRRLTGALGDDLGVPAGGARIYWTGVQSDDDSTTHPVVGRDSGEAVNRLVQTLGLTRPEVRGHVEHTEGRLENARQRATTTTRELRKAHEERDHALQRAGAAEAALADLEGRHRAFLESGINEADLRAIADYDLEAVMQRLICHAWLTALKPADRHQSPLRGYRLGPQFLASIGDRKNAAPRERIAFACAMVACGRASLLPGLEPHPWREGKASGSGDDPQLTRGDGGKGFLCNLGHGRGAARLFYWALPEGITEFEGVRNHDAIGRS
jgi:hypothetical protein